MRRTPQAACNLRGDIEGARWLNERFVMLKKPEQHCCHGRDSLALDRMARWRRSYKDPRNGDGVSTAMTFSSDVTTNLSR